MLEDMWEELSDSDSGKLNTKKFEIFLENNFSKKKIGLIKSFYKNEYGMIQDKTGFFNTLVLCPIRIVNLRIN